MVEGLENLPHEVLLLLGIKGVQALLGADVPPVAYITTFLVIGRQHDLGMLLLRQALVELHGERIRNRCGRCSLQRWKRGRCGAGTDGAKNITAAEGPCGGGVEARVHGESPFQTMEKSQHVQEALRLPLRLRIETQKRA